MNNRHPTLIDGYLDETLTPDQLSELESWINANPDHAKQFADAVHFDERMTAELSWQQFTQSGPDESNPAEPTSRPVALATHRRSQRLTWGVAAIAATVLLVTGLVIRTKVDPSKSGRPTTPSVAQNPSSPASPDNEIDTTFATLVQSIDATWESDHASQSGDRLNARTIRLRSGIVQVQFDSGVEVTLEGPASYELQSMDRTKLAYGLLSATVPPGAEGFRVDTPSAQVIDLGTAFGIELERDGLSKVSVFDGEVEVVTDKDHHKRLLTEGQSVELSSDGSMSDIAFDTGRFEKLWPFGSGIVKSTGAFRFAPPWPRLVNRIQSDRRIFVLPEGYATRLQSPCSVDLTVPGRYTKAALLLPAEVSTGHRVRSFLLMFNPKIPIDTENNRQRPTIRDLELVEGSITFQQPILGVIVEDKTLFATDGRFSLRSAASLPFGRGLELDASRIGDVITLSEDRQTIDLSLMSFGRRGDHVRVIVDASIHSRFSRRPSSSKSLPQFSSRSQP
ncbi:putative transmembrane protein [Rhodopirellula islandica]|uniref:Transmembrane protein n=1 Tax=Rhodopirellula islandica TaxID=595434 RepID=A0A0J1B470_RHOIS|nr:FecR domain-containing protein [Rhodopirellula islandica]KLU01388.1 putative transmembrane protein [Rhodopirellula islandica]